MTDPQRQDRHDSERPTLAAKLLEMQDRERRLIACEIHDGFVQSATAALMSLQALRNVQQQETDKYNQTLDKAIGSLMAWVLRTCTMARYSTG